MKKDIKLICQIGGHNKFYNLTQIDTTSFKVEWGRIGTTPQIDCYGISQWDSKYKEKIKKGYIDVSTSEKSIQELFDELDAKIAAREAREMLIN